MSRLGYSIKEPAWFPDDGGAQRVPVLDHNFTPPRIIRRVGWRKCIACTKAFFSRDVAGNRMCDGCRHCLTE